MKERSRMWLLGFLGWAIAIGGVCGCDGSDEGTGQWNHAGNQDAISAADSGGELGDDDWDDSAYESADISVSSGEATGSGGEYGEEGNNPNVKAGVYDDNESFEAFLDYLSKYAELWNVIPVDVSERYLITVVAAGAARPLPGAKVDISANDAAVFTGTTNATGRLLFHPRAHGTPEDVESFDYTTSLSDKTVSFGQFERVPGGATVTIGADVGYQVPETIRVDIALLLDTTSSMADEIQKLKDTYKLVTTQISAIAPNLDIRFGMVLYRDKGDEYITKVVPFTSDMSSFLESIMQVAASGGGDIPEDLQRALGEALHTLKWRENADIRILFTLADAAPQFYANETTYPELLKEAVAMGIHLHAIAASGSSEAAEYVSRQMAQFCLGHFLFLTYSNDVPGKPGSGTGSGGADGYTVHQYLSGTLDELMVKLVTQDVYAILGLPIPGSPEPEPPLAPEPDDCSLALDFQCGFMAVCEDGVLKAQWHVHEFTEGQEVEDIVDYSCKFACLNGCEEGEILDWPADGDELIAGYCL